MAMSMPRRPPTDELEDPERCIDQLHRCGHARSPAARYLNGWATTVRREQPRVECHRQPRLNHLST